MRGDDRGSGTVLVLGLIAVVGVLAGLLGLVVGAQSARAHAQVTADLAALAAAGSIAAPTGMVVSDDAVSAADPCGQARAVAARNTGTIAACTVLPRGVVQVRVEVPVALGTAHAEARAGPASARERPVSPGE